MKRNTQLRGSSAPTIWVLTLALLLLPNQPEVLQQDRTASLPQLLRETFQGDLAEMRQRGLIRVLVTYNRSNFFLDGPVSRGFEYELLQEYARWLQQEQGEEPLHTELVFIPLPLHELIPALNAGRGDIAAAGLTITPQRSREIAFSDPYIEEVNEVVVGHQNAPPLTSLDGLAGQRVFVVRGSSYADHLGALNRDLASRGLPPMEISEVVDSMQTEDLLEMVGRGVIPYTLADEHLARLWEPVFEGLRIYPELAVNRGGKLAWALRPSNPDLRHSLNRFLADNAKGSLIGNLLFERYFEKNDWLKDPLGERERAALLEIAELLREYAEHYGFDWLLVAAQAYQESGFNHSRVSPAGAIGVMQLRKSTAADRAVGIRDITRLESNIHAGVKYLAHLRDHFFDDPELEPDTRLYFALAAYNAGPSKVRRMRQRAEEMGLNPNRWIANTELAALELVGQETVRYVRNIIRYYTAYHMSFHQQKELHQMLPERGPAASQLNGRETDGD